MFNRIAPVLKEKKIRQDELARYLGTTPAKVSRWCTNISQPSWEILHSISKFLKLDMQHLVYGTRKIITLKGEVSLSSLGVNDALLQLVVGKTELQKFQGGYLQFDSNYLDGSKHSYPLSLISYLSLYQNPKIPVLEIGKIINDCKVTTVKAFNCKEELQLTFLC